MSKKYKRYLVPVWQDTHGGSKLGLLNPATPISHEIRTPDGNTLFETRPAYLNPSQEKLWEIYEWCLGEVASLAKGDEIHAVHDGDLTQGNKYYDDVAYASVANQITIAQWNVMPILRLKNIKSLRLVWGTDSHIFQENSSPILVEQFLSLRFPSKDVRSLPHALMDVGGVIIDVAHHRTNIGGRDWLEGNEMRYYMRSALRGHYRAGRTMPHVFCGAHYHVAREEWLVDHYDRIGRHKSVFVLGPSFTFMNDHARKVTKSNPVSTVGMYVIEIINGNVHDIHWFTKSYDLRIKEKLA